MRRFNVSKTKYVINQNKKYIINKNINLRQVDLGAKSFINCFNKNGNNKLIIQNNKVFLNKVNETNKFGVNLGNFKLTNNNDKYPVGFVCQNDVINVNNGTYVQSKYIDGMNINFYTGDITFSVLKKFDQISLYFLNDGYLNGKNKIVFTNLCDNVTCNCDYFQSYDMPISGAERRLCMLSSLWQNILCLNSKNAQIRRIINQQDLYTLMRLKPEIFPIISSVKRMNLPLNYQRQYSNMWYRQFGTSQALPVNDNFGGFYCPGSEVPYTN